MKPYPLLFKPALKKRIWAGGTRIKEYLGYPSLDEDIGEAWVASDHPECKSIIVNGELSGESIGVLTTKHKLQCRYKLRCCCFFCSESSIRLS